MFLVKHWCSKHVVSPAVVLSWLFEHSNEITSFTSSLSRCICAEVGMPTSIVPMFAVNRLSFTGFNFFTPKQETNHYLFWPDEDVSLQVFVLGGTLMSKQISSRCFFRDVETFHTKPHGGTLKKVNRIRPVYQKCQYPSRTYFNPDHRGWRLTHIAPPRAAPLKP